MIGIENIDFVICRICNKKLRCIDNRHLIKHNLTSIEYKDKYPNELLISDKTKELLQQDKQGKTYEEIYGEENAAFLKDNLSLQRTATKSTLYLVGLNHSIRSAVLKRDNNECILCFSKKDLQIHHVEQISKFENIDNYNHISNLIALCRKCHGSMHKKNNAVNKENKFPNYNQIIRGMNLIISGLGIAKNMNEYYQEHLLKTPLRAAKGIVELCNGLFLSEPAVTLFEANGYNQLIVIKDIEFSSVCIHHFLIFEGVIHIAYLPDKFIVGASKIPRIVEYFAHRPQIQENLSCQIADFIMDKILPKGVLVIVEGRHTCMACRGIKLSAIMKTSALRGIFLDHPQTKMEAIALINGGMVA